MKILVVSNLYPPDVIGGYELQCAQAVNFLRQCGHDVRVLTSVPRRAVVSRESHVMRRLTTPDVYSNERVELRSPYWEFESNLVNTNNVYLLLDVLTGWEPDVCYLWNLVALGGVGLLAALELMGTAWVWHLGDSVPAMLCNFEGELAALGQQMAAMFSGRFLACSRTVIDKVEHLVPIGSRTRLLPNWVTGTSPVVDRSYFAGGTLKVMFAGRVSEEKGSFLLPEIVARLLDFGHRNFVLDVIGTGMVGELESLIAKEGVGEYINLKGWMSQSDVRQCLRRSDVFAFPTYADDPMPLATLEAAAEGCVPLIPWVTGVSEWLVDGVHCLKAERTADGFASAIGKVLDGDIDLAGLSGRAVGAVHENFAIETVMPAVEAELAIAAHNRREPSADPEDLYRLALIADAMLRRHVVESTGTFGASSGAEV